MGAERQTIRRSLAAWLLIMALGTALFGWGRPAQALNFALHSLQELADESDELFIGTVTGEERGGDEMSQRYTLRVERALAGELAAGDSAAVEVVQFADEGKLELGGRYLMLLADYQGGYAVSGVHQGFVKLAGGSSESSFYKPDEVERLLAQYGLGLDEDWDAAAASWPRRESGGGADADGGVPGLDGRTNMLSGLPWAALAAVVALAVLLLRRRRSS